MADQVTTGRFVGRTHELARLGELLARATDGQPLLVLLGGEAGVGKTRLVEQLAAAAQEQGTRVLYGGCVPLGEEGVPFAPVVEALRGLADQLDPAELAAVAGPARQELARLLPDLAWGGAAAPAPAVAAVAGQGRLFERLLGVVQRLATTAPLLLIVEDLHWADRSTRDLLAFLATSLRSGRVLVVGSFRSDELDRLHPLRRLLGELGRNRRVVRLELARFSRAELAEQLAGLLGTDPSVRLVDDVYARSGGNPFFAEELLLAGEGAGAGALPPSLREVLLARVVRLGDRTQQLLRVAAAAGSGATQPLLAAVAGIDDQALLAGLREAVDQQLLLPEPGSDGYVFRHALLAEAVHSELLPGERVRLHSALAGALEAGLEVEGAPASRAARIAYHWSAAGDQPRALTASVAAAAAAEQAYAFAEAQLQLERALELWDQVPDAEARVGMDRVGLLARCAETAYWAGDIVRAAELVRQALGLVDAARQPRRAGLLHEQLARCLGRLGDPWAGALAEQQQAVRLVAPEPSAERARVLGSLALYLERADRFAEARELAEEAIAIAGQVGAHAEEANARTALGAALGYLGEPDAGLAELAAARRLATQAGDVILALRTIVYHSDVLLAAGHLDQAATVALDGLDQARHLGLARSYGPVLAANATEALVALGRWDQADQVSRQALETAPSDAVSVHLPLVRAALELGLGDLDAAQARLQATQRLLPAPIPVAERAGLLFAGLAELAVWRGDLDQAKQLVAEAVPQVASNPRYAAPSTPWGCGWRPTLPSWPGPATPASPPPTTPPPPPCSNGSPRPPPARPPPACRSWPPGTPSGWPSRPASRAGLTRPPGRRRRPRGSGWVSPTGSPTPASATPRRSWPPATATAPRRCWAAPPPSPAVSAPAPSTPRCTPWPGVPASTSARPPKPPPRRPARRHPRSSWVSPPVRSRCWRWWRPGAATARSPRRCSSAPRPSACTSPTSWPSWAWPGGWRRPRSPTVSAWTDGRPAPRVGRHRVVVDAVAGRRSGVGRVGDSPDATKPRGRTARPEPVASQPGPPEPAPAPLKQALPGQELGGAAAVAHPPGWGLVPLRPGR
jgi:tetratricopeptide (TPR) repeat protein